MDMNVNIYLPDELGERVRKADLEVSRICQRALTTEVERVETEKQAKKNAKFERIEVEVGDGEGPFLTKAFEGEWLIEDYEFNPEGWNNLSGGQNYTWNVALTKGGNIAVYRQDGTDADSPASLDVYHTLDDADDDVPEEVLAAAAAAMGSNRVIELDI